MSRPAMAASILLGILVALTLASSPASAVADVPTHAIGDKVGFGTSIDLGEAAALAIDFINQEDVTNDTFEIHELSFDGSVDIWATQEVVDVSPDAYTIRTNSVLGFRLQYVVNVTLAALPAAGTYPGNMSLGCLPDHVDTAEVTVYAEADVDYLLASTGLSTWTVAEFALQEDETNSSIELRAVESYRNVPTFDLSLSPCQLTIAYESVDYTSTADVELDLRTVYDPALDLFAFPIVDEDVWTVESSVTQGGRLRGTVDVAGLEPDEEQQLFDGINQALEAAGFTVTGLDGFPINLEAVTIMHGLDTHLKDGVIHDTTNPFNAILVAQEGDMVLADGSSHTVYLISPFTGTFQESPCAHVYSPDDGFIVGFRCAYAGYEFFELENVPPATAEEHIARTKRDYSPSGTASPNFLGTFFMEPPFFGLLLVAAVAVLVAALLVRRRRKPAVAPPGAMPPMPPQAPPPGPP